MQNIVDQDETREWLDALQSVIEFEGTRRADELLNKVVESARRSGARLPFSVSK